MLKEVSTDQDEFITNSQLKTFSLESLALIPMPGIEGLPLDYGDIMEVVLRAGVGTTSVNGITAHTDETSNREPVIGRLHALEKVLMLEAVNDILVMLAMSVLDCGGTRTICIDFMNNSHYGEPEDGEDELRRMSARDGTTQCHCYCIAFVIARGKPLMLAIEPVDSGDSKVDAIEQVLRVETYPSKIEHILIDHTAYVGKLIGGLWETSPSVFPVKTRKESLREKLSVSASYMAEETICEGKEHEQTFPLAVNVTYQNGDRGKSGVKTTGTRWQIAPMCDKRSRIKKSYEKFREVRAMTSVPSPVIRLFYVGVSFLLEQLWLVV